MWKRLEDRGHTGEEGSLTVADGDGETGGGRWLSDWVWGTSGLFFSWIHIYHG